MIEIRPLHEHRGVRRSAFNSNKLIWGFDDVELLPVRLFVTATKIGGQAFGAYDGDRDAGNMIGFCLAIPGIKPNGNKSYLHSHMLGVMKEYRDAGVGRMLKLEQRERCARARDRTDGMDLRSARNQERVFQHRAAGRDRAPLRAAINTGPRRAICTRACRPIAALRNGGWRASGSKRLWMRAASRSTAEVVARISVPAAIYEIKENDPAQAREIQKRVSAISFSKTSRKGSR